MKINANIPALQTSRHLNKTNDKIQKALEKLSTGYKINSVDDDPTGTAISSKIKAQLYGLKLANKNAMDGISLVQTAEGAMSEVHEMLKRIRELSVQAGNDTNSPDDRNKLQMEVDQLIEAIDEMANVTEFNQMKLLNGSLSNLTTIKDTAGAVSYDLSVKYMSTNFPAGEYQIEVTQDFGCASVSGSYSMPQPATITLNNDTVEILSDDTASDIQNKIKDLADRYNCTVEFATGSGFNLTAKEAGGDVALTLNIKSTNGLVNTTVSDSGTDADVDITGFSSAAVVKIEGNRVIITESGGAEIQIDLTEMGTLANKIYNLKIEDKGQLKLQTGANEEQRIALMIPGLSSYSLGLSKQAFGPGSTADSIVNLVNIKNVEGAERSGELLDAAIEKVSLMRSSLGAYQNRLEHTVKSLDINSTNTEESLSRIQDTDMALEMSRYTLSNVVLQSAISMLSQANERPQQLLQLLR